MHELAVCQSLLQQVASLAAQHHANKVMVIQLQIGPLSGIEPQLLAQAFPLASAGTIAADAVLQVESAPIRVRCQQCGAETNATANRLLCGVCGDWQTQLLSGDEMLLVSVELQK
jgi:hydrogenase nickel incorporation protein HypA/HybF